ncbi:hypothetical protein RB195_014923 [Necator americanus]|uniref:Clc-like protein n=1 Tax=Necator americanus TaxID=51031 RepID=A0ABR1E2H0_NECAM
MYKFVLIASIVLIIGGMLLTACSLFSPLWQIAERPKSAEIHHHGLWWDCVVSDGTLIPLGEAVPIQKSENCANKFDPTVQLQLRSALETSDTSSRELLLHRFLPHHKAVIFFSVFTFVFGTIGLITGACSPCFPPNSLLYVVSIFMTRDGLPVSAEPGLTHDILVSRTSPKACNQMTGRCKGGGLESPPTNKLHMSTPGERKFSQKLMGLEACNLPMGF